MVEEKAFISQQVPIQYKKQFDALTNLFNNKKKSEVLARAVEEMHRKYIGDFREKTRKEFE